MPPKSSPFYALKLFPILNNFLTFRPRRIDSVPLGNNKTRLDDKDISVCLRHLYHDLGVLAFEGTNYENVRRIGDIISRVVSSGGPGALTTMVEWATPYQKRRIAPLREEDVFESYNDINQAGVIKPITAFRIADATLRDHITTHLLPATNLSPKQIHLRDRKNYQQPLRLPFSVLHYTSSSTPNLRPLPLDAYTTLTANRRWGHIIGNVNLFTAGGKGTYVGTVRIEYVPYHVDKDKGKVTFVSQRHKLFEPTPPDVEDEALETRKHARSVIKTHILEELFQLEAEILGDKLDRMVQDAKGPVRQPSKKAQEEKVQVQKFIDDEGVGVAELTDTSTTTGSGDDSDSLYKRRTTS